MDSVTDNIVKFPSKELDIVFTPEEEMKHEEIVHAVTSSLMFQADGIESGSEATWDHIMDAAINVAITAGVNSGLTFDQIELMFNIMQIQEVEYDA